MNTPGLRRKIDRGILRLALLALAAVAGSGCGRDSSGIPPEQSAAWRQALEADRAAKDREFATDAMSPMAGAVRLTLAAPGGGLRVDAGAVTPTAPPGPRDPLVFSRVNGQWLWESRAPGGWAEVARSPIPPGPLSAGIRFRLARFTLAAYPGADGLTLIVFDPARRERREFRRLLYFPPDRAFAVPARLERLPDPETVVMLTSRNLEKRFVRYARLHFTVNGTACALTAFQSAENATADRTLFVPFTDATTGTETYPAGRFLDLDEPDGETMVLDFNRAYNPLCNYSPAYNCPIPPAENRLAVAIRAGELTYPH